MASTINTIKNGSGINSFQGRWEDIQWYTTVKINVNSPVSGEVKLHWANPPKGRLPTDSRDLIATTDISCVVELDINGDPIPLTFERDTIARWFRLDFCAASTIDNSLNIEVLYKKAPTSVKLVDSSNQVVSVENGNLYSVLVDNQGNVLRSTDTAAGEALFTNFRDASGDAMLTVSGQGLPHSLAVALRDNCSNEEVVSNFDTLGIKGKSTVNAMYMHMSDACGHSQASGYTVSGADVAGVPLFLTLNDVDSTNYVTHPVVVNNDPNETGNFLYVFAGDKDGSVHNTSNPLKITQTSDIAEVLSFDISSAVNERWRTHSALKGGSQRARSLYNVYAYNDGPTLVWLRIYDLSVADGATDPSPATYDLNPYIMQTIPLGPGQTYDTTYPRGIQFNNGVAFRATVEPYINSTQGPGDDVVFVAGTYTTAIISDDMSASVITGWGSEENHIYHHHQSHPINPLALTVTRDEVTKDGVWTFRWTQPSQYVGENNYTLAVDSSDGALVADLVFGITGTEQAVSTTDMSVSTTDLTNTIEYTGIQVTNTGAIGNMTGTWDAGDIYYSLVKDNFALFGNIAETNKQIDNSGYLRLAVELPETIGYLVSGASQDLSFCAISGELGDHIYMTIASNWDPTEISNDADSSISFTANFGVFPRKLNISVSLTEQTSEPFEGYRYACILQSIDSASPAPPGGG